MNTFLEDTNLFRFIGELGIIEESFKIGNEFVNVLAFLAKGFELFTSLLLGDLIFESMIQITFENSPGSKVIIGKCVISVSLAPIKGRAFSHV